MDKIDKILPLIEKHGPEIIDYVYDNSESLRSEIEKRIDEKINKITKIIEDIPSRVSMLVDGVAIEVIEGPKGDAGNDPTDEHLVSLIEPLIPEPLKPSDEELVDLILPLIPEPLKPSDEEIVNLIKPLIPEAKVGKSPTDEHLKRLITPMIPKLEKETAKGIVDKINSGIDLIQKDKIDIDWKKFEPKTKEYKVEDIKGLPDAIKKLQYSHAKASYDQVAGGGSSTALKTNGLANGSQTILNLKQGTNVTLTDDGIGGVTINSTGGGGGAVTSVNGYTGVVVLTKSDLSLGNVDNTSDANKPVSTATQTALNLKQNTITLTTTGTSGAATLVGATLNIPQYSGSGGTVTSVTSATADATVATTTTTPVITIVSAPKLTTARTIAGVSFDGTANISLNNNAITNGAGYTTNVGTVTSVTGTTNRITVATGTTTPVIDIAATYVGQSSITTLGTISTGVWQGTAIADAYISSAATWNAKFTLPSLTTGSVLFSNGTTIAQDNSNFFWDDTNNRLGIGLNNPGATLTVNGSNPIFRMVNSGGRTIGDSINYEFAVDGTTQNALGGFKFVNTGGGNAAHDFTMSLWDGSSGAPERFRIQATTGNVGIGTIAPASKLEVAGAITLSGSVVASGPSLSNSVDGLLLVAGASNGLRVNNSANSVELMRMSNAGNLGVGTSNPQVKMEVMGSGALNTNATVEQFNLTRPFNGGFSWPQVASFKIGGYNTSTQGTRLDIGLKESNNSTLSGEVDIMTLLSSGVVGIGTTSPLAKLHIASTTEQLRLAYNTSNYVTKTVGSSGRETIDAVGSDAGHTFVKPVFAGVDYRVGFTLFSDFMGLSLNGYQVEPFTHSDLGGVTAQTTGVAGNRPGIAVQSTSTSATGRAALITAATNCFTFAAGTWVFETDVNVETLSTGTERFSYLAGFLSAITTTTQAEAIGFLYDEGGVSTGSAASANWQVVTATGSVRTYTTTSTAVAANTWVRLRIEVNAAGTSVVFKINGTTVATHTTNIPVGVASTGGGLLLLKSIGTTARNVRSDFIYIETRFTTAR